MAASAYGFSLVRLTSGSRQFDQDKIFSSASLHLPDLSCRVHPTDMTGCGNETAGRGQEVRP